MLEGSVARVANFRYIFPVTIWVRTMTDVSPVTEWRQRRRRQGFVRVEVQVRQEDAALLREVASALGDPAREAGVRAILREKVIEAPNGGLKALLAAAPFEGIELDRPRDFGREAVF